MGNFDAHDGQQCMRNKCKRKVYQVQKMKSWSVNAGLNKGMEKKGWRYNVQHESGEVLVQHYSTKKIDMPNGEVKAAMHEAGGKPEEVVSITPPCKQIKMS